MKVPCARGNPVSILTLFSPPFGQGRRSLHVGKKTIFAQGDATDAVFYIQKGKVKLTVGPVTAKKQPSAYWETAIFSAKAALPASRFISGRQAR